MLILHYFSVFMVLISVNVAKAAEPSCTEIVTEQCMSSNTQQEELSDVLDIHHDGATSLNEILTTLAYLVHSLEQSTSDNATTGELTLHEIIASASTIITNLVYTNTHAAQSNILITHVGQLFNTINNLAKEAMGYHKIPTSLTVSDSVMLFENQEGARAYLKNVAIIDQIEQLSRGDTQNNKKDQVARDIVTSFMRMLGNLANIIANPKNPENVHANTAGMIEQIINIAQTAKRKALISPTLYTQEIEQYLRSDAHFAATFTKYVIKEAEQVRSHPC